MDRGGQGSASDGGGSHHYTGTTGTHAGPCGTVAGHEALEEPCMARKGS